MIYRLVDFETERRFALLESTADEPVWHTEKVGEGEIAQGDWLHGYFRGDRESVFAVYWDGGRMFVATARRVVTLDAVNRRMAEVQWRARGPLAQIRVRTASGEQLMYRYLRSPTQLLERQQYPDHELPRWLDLQWNDPQIDYDPKLAKGGIYPAHWHRASASSGGPDSAEAK